jgi:phosphoglycerate-specific signal transduction histidine kinase
VSSPNLLESTAIVSLKQENLNLKAQIDSLKESFAFQLDSINQQMSFQQLALEEQRSQNGLLLSRLNMLIEMAPSKGDEKK